VSRPARAASFRSREGLERPVDAALRLIAPPPPGPPADPLQVRRTARGFWSVPVPVPSPSSPVCRAISAAMSARGVRARKPREKFVVPARSQRNSPTGAGTQRLSDGSILSMTRLNGPIRRRQRANATLTPAGTWGGAFHGSLWGLARPPRSHRRSTSESRRRTGKAGSYGPFARTGVAGGGGLSLTALPPDTSDGIWRAARLQLSSPWSANDDRQTPTVVQPEHKRRWDS